MALGPERFDVVCTGKGALCYLPDLPRWAGVVAELLCPGGMLYLVEFHPLLNGPAVEGATDSFEWMHGIGEVVTALSQAGLTVRRLRESDELPWQRWPHLVRTPSGWWRLPEPRIPLLYGLLATR